MSKPLHTVVETPDYLRDAKRAGMTARDLHNAVQSYADDPAQGEEVVGSGGVRKGRLAGRGKGKSGGYRIVALYIEPDIPVYLIAVLSKGDRENFSDNEVKAFKSVSVAIKNAWRVRRAKPR